MFSVFFAAAFTACGADWPRVEFRPGAAYVARVDFVCASNQTGGVVNFNMKGMLLNAQVKGVKAGETNRLVRVFRPHGAGAPWSEAPRFGTWRVTGEVLPSGAETVEVEPVYARFGDLSLGAGEMLVDGHYRFTTRFAGGSSNADRAFYQAEKARFHDPCWRVSPGGSVTYRHEVEGRMFDSASLRTVVENAAGGWRISVSLDAVDWREVASFPKGAKGKVKLPEDLFPCKTFFVRVSGAATNGFYLASHSVSARLDRKGGYALGSTSWREKRSGRTVEFPGVKAPPVPAGALLPGDDPRGLRLWTCDSGWKVMKDSPAPKRRARGIALRLAADETEAVQFVLRPDREMPPPLWRASELSDGKGNAIAAANVEIFRVGYVPVSVPTDRTSKAGWWPDPLFRLDDAPEKLLPGENQPYWVRVKAPAGTKSGIYRGTISAGGVSLPLAVEVFGFTLPKHMTCESAFAVRHYQLLRYQRPGKAAREVIAKYIKSLADHRLAAYDPEPHVKLKCSWENADDPVAARPVFNWAEWDAKIARSFDELGYTAINFPQLGTIGGGTYQARWPGKILDWKAGTKEYDVLFAKFWREIDRHLVGKGWAEKAYVYWFDEPRDKDLAFVADGFARLKRHAPHLRRMITSGCERELMDGVNHWCPLTPALHKDREEDARKRGDCFWWYVCTGPKAPYATLFIDKPGTEPRVWLWQTWGEKVTGILFWNTIYWTSESVYNGGTLQNPYLDPQSWEDGNPVPWGNGDGRLFYPPRECFGADGLHVKDGAPVTAGPVETCRLELVRDGIEDYEYFAMLQRLDPGNALLQVPADVYSSLTEFTDDPEPIGRHRLRLAREIERLGKGRIMVQ